MSANALETRIRKANLRYRKAECAVIQKLEVPIRMTPQGMVATLSTVDFYGAIKTPTTGALPIAFDAKETISKTSFPLANIHQHQLEYLNLWTKIGGIGFFLIHFKKIHPDHAYVTPITLVDAYWNNEHGRKSIPLTGFQQTWLTPIDSYLTHFNVNI